MQVDLARGYSHPQLHNLSAKVSLDAVEALTEHEPLPLANCTRTARRFRGNQFVMNETKVAAIRISANGWEAGILHGLQVRCRDWCCPFMRQQCMLIVILLNQHSPAQHSIPDQSIPCHTIGMAWHGIHAKQLARQVLTHVVVPLQDVIASSPPSVILMELNPSQMEAVGLADAATLLQQLYDMGYTDISHSGWGLYVAL